jgi:short subunit dehydrogenase-like uncharacterized protein
MVTGPRIVLLGATGFTGEFVAKALVAHGVRPVLAGRNTAKLEAVAGTLAGEADIAHADVDDTASVAALVRRGDVLISTVGPFVKYGKAAVTAAAEAGAHYFDSTGEGPFIREVFERYGPVAAKSGSGLLTAFGYDYVPGNLAAGLALKHAGPEAVRVDSAYFMTDANGERDLRTRFGLPSAGTVSTLLNLLPEPAYALRDGAIVTERVARRVGGYRIAGHDVAGVSIGAVEQFGLSQSFPQLREVNVYLGWFDPLSRFLQLGSLAIDGNIRRRVAGAVLRRIEPRLTAGRPAGPSAEVRENMRALIVGTAYDARGSELARVILRGPEPYVFTGDLLAWGAIQAIEGGLRGTGALGPVAAFGLDELEKGCAAVGLVVTEER